MSTRSVLMSGIALLMTTGLFAQSEWTSVLSPRFMVQDVLELDRAEAIPGLRSIVFTDDQMTKAKAIAEKTKADLKTLGDKAKAAQKAYSDAVKEGKSTPEQLRPLYLEVQGAYYDLNQAYGVYDKALEALLTTEQQAQLKKYEDRIKEYRNLLK